MGLSLTALGVLDWFSWHIGKQIFFNLVNLTQERQDFFTALGVRVQPTTYVAEQALGHERAFLTGFFDHF